MILEKHKPFIITQLLSINHLAWIIILCKQARNRIYDRAQSTSESQKKKKAIRAGRLVQPLTIQKGTKHLNSSPKHLQWFTVFLYQPCIFTLMHFQHKIKCRSLWIKKWILLTGCDWSSQLTLKSRPCLFPDYLLSHVSYPTLERIQHPPNQAELEELKHSGAVAGAGAPRCHWGGCQQLATCQALQATRWRSGQRPLLSCYSDLQLRWSATGTHPLATLVFLACSAADCLPGYLQHYVHTYDTEFTQGHSPCPNCTRGRRVPLYP